MGSSVEATAAVFWTAFQALSRKERDAVLKKMLSEKDFVEDLMDIVTINKRKDEPSRSLDAYLADRKKSTT